MDILHSFSWTHIHPLWYVFMKNYFKRQVSRIIWRRTCIHPKTLKKHVTILHAYTHIYTHMQDKMKHWYIHIFCGAFQVIKYKIPVLHFRKNVEVILEVYYYSKYIPRSPHINNNNLLAERERTQVSHCLLLLPNENTPTSFFSPKYAEKTREVEVKGGERRDTEKRKTLFVFFIFIHLYIVHT